jgi:hypothetical protein
MTNFADIPQADGHKRKMALRIGFGIVLAGAVAFCGYQAWRCIDEYQQHVANMHAFSAEQEKYDTQAMNAAATVPVEASEVKDYMSLANKAGKELADLQTGYQNVASDGIKEYAEKRVGPYFTEEGQPDRVVWCEALQVPYKWEFLSAYEFKDGVIPCVFKCTVGDGVLVAYAHASFDPNTGRFSNVDRSYTVAIRDYQLAEDMSPNAQPSDSGGSSSNQSDSGSSNSTTSVKAGE